MRNSAPATNRLLSRPAEGRKQAPAHLPPTVADPPSAAPMQQRDDRLLTVPSQLSTSSYEGKALKQK